MKLTVPALSWALVILAATAAGAVELYVNNNLITTQPGIVVENGVSYGPLRAVAESVGGKVEWNEAQQRAMVCRGTSCVLINASEGIQRENRLLLPIRKLAEKLGGTVRWSGGASPRIDIAMPPAG